MYDFRKEVNRVEEYAQNFFQYPGGDLPDWELQPGNQVVVDLVNGEIRGGTALDKKKIKETLNLTDVYTTRRVEVYGWHTDVYLVGYSVPFNSVCLKRVP